MAAWRGCATFCCGCYDWSKSPTFMESQRNSGFQTFCKLARVLCSRSLVPKVADSNCGAENVPVLTIYFCSCFWDLFWAWNCLTKLGWSTYRWICDFRLAWWLEQVNWWGCVLVVKNVGDVMVVKRNCNSRLPMSLQPSFVNFVNSVNFGQD